MLLDMPVNSTGTPQGRKPLMPRSAWDVVSVHKIKELNAYITIPEYNTILWEVAECGKEGSSVSWEEMIH
jgi:hypothetical protein